MRPPNIVIVTVDCLRRDRVSAYGHDRETTPFLDRLLDRSLHCTSAHSVSSWTCPAVCSLLTGLYPHNHGGGQVPGRMKNLSKQHLPTVLPAEVPTLPEILSAQGYATAALGAVWNAHLPFTAGRLGHMAMIERPAPTLVSRAVRWMRGQDRPFFLWLHLGDTHEPLDIPRSMRNLFGHVPRIRNVRRWAYTTAGSRVTGADFRRYREARVRLYDVAVRSVDSSLSELWAALDAMGERNRTILAISSDHGEEFWEHRDAELGAFTDPRDVYGTGHGHNLFQVHLLVPLIVVGPEVPARVVDRNVSLVDVLPTVMSAAGMDPPAVDGRSLLNGVPDRPVLAEAIAYGHEKKSVVFGDRKLLVSPDDGYEAGFRLGPDRREAGTIEDPGEVAALRRHLPQTEAELGEQVEATEEIVEHLRGLGYIE